MVFVIGQLIVGVDIKQIVLGKISEIVGGKNSQYHGIRAECQSLVDQANIRLVRTITDNAHIEYFNIAAELGFKQFWEGLVHRHVVAHDKRVADNQHSLRMLSVAPELHIPVAQTIYVRA